MAQWECDRCRGSGWASAARDSGTENMPPMLQQIGVYPCSTCNGTGKLGFTDEQEEEIRNVVERMSSNVELTRAHTEL